MSETLESALNNRNRQGREGRKGKFKDILLNHHVKFLALLASLRLKILKIFPKTLKSA